VGEGTDSQLNPYLLFTVKVVVLYTVIQFLDQENLHGNLKFPIQNERERPAAAKGKPEATIRKIRKEAKTASISREN
jgi:hypothetical protein